MHQLAVVSGLQTGGNLSRNGSHVRFIHRHRGVQFCLECFARQPLHGDKRQPIMLANLIDRDHIGMLDRSGQASLSDKPIPSHRP